MGKDKAKSQKHCLRWSRKKLFIIVSVAVVILIIGLGGWLYFTGSNRSAIDKQAEQATNRATVISSTSNEAQKIISSGGDISDASKIYDEAIVDTTDTQLKSELSLSKATIYSNEGKYDEALAIANIAEQYHKSDVVYYFIARVYEKKNDKPNAIINYQKAIDYIDGSNPMAEEDANYYRYMIDQLNG